MAQVGRSQMEGIVEALVDAANDKDESTQVALCKAIVDIGIKKHVSVIKICLNYLTKYTKLPKGHRIIILNLMERVTKEHIHSIPESLANELVTLGSAELTAVQDVVPDWQEAASKLLITLGLRYAKLVFQELITKFQPGVIPHYFVLQTLGHLATTNVVEIVPLLKPVLGRVLPLMGAVKLDNVQWVFANVIARFCEAIIDFLADEQRARGANISAEQFSGEVFSAYEQLFNVWLQSKEAKVRIAVVDAIGFAVHLCAADALNEQLPKLIPGVVQLFKKHTEQYHISQCLGMIVDAACIKKCSNMAMILDTLLPVLHQHACIPVNMANPVSMKDHNESLRCFAAATKGYNEKIVSFLLSKLEVVQEKSRVPTLDIIKHLINSCSTELGDKKPMIVNGLKILLPDPSLRVRRIFEQTIIAMAHHGYLALEGGSVMVEYIAKQCALDPEDKAMSKLANEELTPTALRDMSDSVLVLVTTTIEHMEPVLWPYLVEFLTPAEYTGALGVMCKCVASIGFKKRKAGDEDYKLNFAEQVNLPKPNDLLARLFVMSGFPHNGRNRGEQVLNCLQALGPNLHEDVVTLFDTAVPRLVTYLTEQDEKGTWDQKLWEDRMLKLLSRTLDDINKEEWLLEFGNVFGNAEQVMAKYGNLPDEKGFLYKCMGVILRKATHKQFVQNHLDMMFATIRHSSQVERDGCAAGIGYASSSHIDTVLTKLEMVLKDELNKKGKGGFFSFGKDKSDADVERLKATVMLCYGYVCHHSPPNLIISRMETNVMRNINPHFAKVKDTVVKQNLIRTINIIGQSLHPEHLKSEYIFTGRGDLINHLLEYIRQEPVNVPISADTRTLAITALNTLVKLAPRLTDAEQFDMIKVTTDSIFPLPQPVADSKKKDAVSLEESTALMSGATTELHSLLITILNREFSSSNLESIFKHLEPWILSEDGVERERAICCYLELLRTYLAQADQNEPSRVIGIQFLGQMIGELIPRCSDPVLKIRQTSIESVQVLLKVTTCTAGTTDQFVEAVTLLRDRAEKDEPNALYSLVNDLSKVLCKKLPNDNLWPLVTVLLEGLLDKQPHSSSGACVVLNNIIKLRGPALSDKIPDLINGIYEKLKSITNPQTKTGTLRCMRAITSQFLSASMTHLLDIPLPWDVEMVAIWQVHTGEPQLIKQVFVHLLDTLFHCVAYQEKMKGNRPVRIETPVPKAVTQALILLCQMEEVQPIVTELFSKFLATLLLRIGASTNIESSNPKTKTCIALAVEAFKQFLTLTKSDILLKTLDLYSAWSLLEKEDTFPHGILHVARGLAENYPQEVKPTVDALSNSLMSLYDCHRITVVSLYSELICVIGNSNFALAEQIMNYLLGRQVDSNYMVRIYCIRGLGNMASIGGDQVSRFSTTVLSAMLAGMDDKEDPEDLITMEAMSGLAKIFDQIEEGHVRPILINIALRIRPCFEKPTPSVRAAAYTLFGSLSRFGNGPSQIPFLEQIQTNFVSLLLHLNETDPVVIDACKGALRKVGPLINSSKVNNMFQKHLTAGEALLYPDFLNDLCKLIVVDFIDRVNFYLMTGVGFFKSAVPEIRSNAVLFVGYLLGNMPTENAPVVSKEHICEALILLLKDPSPLVRSSCAEAMSLLYEY
ncbi:hypothetical protein EMCRGX_G031509 [Ephydatia muelleri]